MIEKVDFSGDWISPPGATIADLLEERGLSTDELAQNLGCPISEARGLLTGQTRITQPIAADLAGLLGGTTLFWLTRERLYRAEVDRLAPDAENESDWLKAVPFADMVKFGWVKEAPNRQRLATSLEFFGVDDVPGWHARYRDIVQLTAYRKSSAYASVPAATAAWLRYGEMKSNSIPCGEWNADRFRASLPALRSLTRRKKPSSFVPELVNRCAQCGVAVVIARAPKGCRASGATRFVTPSRALLLLSCRYLSDDQFWFSFFHEAGHLLQHSNGRTFLEGVGTSSEEEREADEFAATTLIPQQYRLTMSSLKLEAWTIAKFAQTVGVSSGIIVGQLQHMKRIPRNHWNDFKIYFDWDELSNL